MATYRTGKFIERVETDRQRRAGKWKKAVKWGAEPTLAVIIGSIGVGLQYAMAGQDNRKEMMALSIGFLAFSTLLTLLLTHYNDSQSAEARKKSRNTQRLGLIAMFVGVVVAAGAERIIKMTEADGVQERQAIEENRAADDKDNTAYETELTGFQDCQKRYEKLGKKQRLATSLLSMCGKRPEKPEGETRFTDATRSIRENVQFKQLGVYAILIAMMVEGVGFLWGYFGAKTEHDELMVEKRRPARQLAHTIQVPPDPRADFDDEGKYRM
jgi:hypothetical protein